MPSKSSRPISDAYGRRGASAKSGSPSHMTDVGRIERAERDPGVRTVAKLARGLGIEPADLLKGVA